MVQSWFQKLFWNQDCYVVSNLLVGIATYNFELFHSALICTYIPWEKITLSSWTKDRCSKGDGVWIELVQCGCDQAVLSWRLEGCTVHTCGVWMSNSAVQHVGDRKWSGWPLAFAILQYLISKTDRVRIHPWNGTPHVIHVMIGCGEKHGFRV